MSDVNRGMHKRRKNVSGGVRTTPPRPWSLEDEKRFIEKLGMHRGEKADNSHERRYCLLRKYRDSLRFQSQWTEEEKRVLFEVASNGIRLIESVRES